MVSGHLAPSAHAERCVGCMLCALRCSVLYNRAFNPLKARVLIGKVNGYSIQFTEKCNNCGVCVDYCLFGALEKSG